MVNECTAYVLHIAWSDYLAHPKWTAVIKRHEADGGQKHKTNNSQNGKHVCVHVKDKDRLSVTAIIKSTNVFQYFQQLTTFRQEW